jgi:hypothetical protein
MSEDDPISKDALNLIRSKAASDPAFRVKLLSSANDVLASIGVKLPPGLTIRFVEDTAATRHFVLPPRAGAELSDQALDRVAGGFGAASPQDLSQFDGTSNTLGKQIGRT